MERKILNEGDKLRNGKNLVRLKSGAIKVVTYFDHDIEPSKTDPQFQAETDINNIMKKYKATGVVTHRNYKTGVYGDFSDVKSYQESLHTVMKAQEAFYQLPSTTRNRFENDPQKLIEFLQDSKNDAEAIKMGLKVERPLSDSDKIVNAINKNKKNDDSNDDKNKNK